MGSPGVLHSGFFCYCVGMRIYISSDHKGFNLKAELDTWLQSEEHEVRDLGPGELRLEDDYPEYAFAVAERVAQEPEARGIVICGSGAGMVIAANKVQGARAALVHDPAVAEAARRDDDTNVLGLGADFVDADKAKDIVEVFLKTPFSGEERHRRRLEQINNYENLRS